KIPPPKQAAGNSHTVDARAHSPTSCRPITWFCIDLIVLSAACWLVYGRATEAPFIFDDSESVTKNTSIIQFWPLIGDSQHPGPLNPARDLPVSGRPLVNLSLAFNFYLGKIQPTGYHIFNIILHSLSAVLLAAILARTLQLKCFRDAFEAVANPLAL